MDKSIPIETPIKSTQTQLESFIKSVVWEDLQNHLQEVINTLLGNMEDVDTLEDMKELQGGIKTARSLLSAPEGLIEELQIRQELNSQ